MPWVWETSIGSQQKQTKETPQRKKYALYVRYRNKGKEITRYDGMLLLDKSELPGEVFPRKTRKTSVTMSSTYRGEICVSQHTPLFRLESTYEKRVEI